MQNLRSKLLILIISLSLAACKGKAPVAETEIFSTELPQDFLDFFERFHTDTTYQMRHISFPLKGLSQNPETNRLDTLTYHPETWFHHKPFNNHGGTFKRTFLNLNGIIIETISDTSESFKMERRFSKLAGEWHLIHYSTFEYKGTVVK